MPGNKLQVVNKLREVNLLEPTNGPNGASNLLQEVNLLAPAAGGNPAPTVTSLSVSSGPAAGGTPITITGTGFLTGATVRFGSNLATSVVVVTSMSITAVTPAGVASTTVGVTVTNTDTQSGTLPASFSYAAAVIPPLVVQSLITTHFPAADFTTTFTNPVTPGNAVFAYFQTWFLNAVVGSVTDNLGNVYTLVSGPDTNAADGGGNGTLRWLYVCLAVSGAPQSITVNFSTFSGSTYGQMSVVEVSNAVSIDASSYSSVNGTSWSGGTITTSGPNELLLSFDGYIDESGNTTISPGVLWTLVERLADTGVLGQENMIQSQAVATPGVNTIDASLPSSKQGGMITVAIK